MRIVKCLRLFLFALLAGALLAPWPVLSAKYTLMVNAGQRAGSWNRFYERSIASDHMHTFISSAYGRNACNALKRAHDELGIQSVRGHGLFDDDDSVYSEDAGGNAVYRWTSVDKIYDSVIAAGMRPLVELGYMPNALASAQTWINSVWYNGVGGNWNAPKDWNKWKAFLQAFLAHLEARYGQAEVRNNWFFELWNEPNWCYGGGGGDNGWLRLYDSTAVAFKAQDSLVRLGGPDENGGTSWTFIPQVIRHCRNGNKKLDFVTYHFYSNDGASNGNATTENYWYKRIADSVRLLNFTGPVLCTEQGPSYTQGIAVHDNNQGASYVAKAIHLLSLNDTNTYPPPYTFALWAVSDVYEETNNTASSPAFCGCYGLMTRGVASIPQSWDVAKPVFNAYKLLHRLGSFKLSCSGGTTASPGVNVLATSSAANDTICIMVYSHVDTTSGNSKTVDTVSLSVTGIPFASARVEHFVVDSTHSNSYSAWIGLGKPSSPTAAQWTTISNASQLAHYDSVTTVPVTGGTFSKTFAQSYYSVALIQLTNSAVPVLAAALKSSPGALDAVVNGDRIRISTGAPESYSVRLFSKSGRKVFESSGFCFGTASIALPRTLQGAFVLQFKGPAGTLVRNVVLRP